MIRKLLLAIFIFSLFTISNTPSTHAIDTNYNLALCKDRFPKKVQPGNRPMIQIPLTAVKAGAQQIRATMHWEGEISRNEVGGWDGAGRNMKIVAYEKLSNGNFKHVDYSGNGTSQSPNGIDRISRVGPEDFTIKFNFPPNSGNHEIYLRLQVDSSVGELDQADGCWAEVSPAVVRISDEPVCVPECGCGLKCDYFDNRYLCVQDPDANLNNCNPKNSNTSLSQPCKNSDLNADGSGCRRIYTALGYVSTDTSNFTRWVLGFILSISGGIVVLIIIISGYKLMTSQGDPEKVKNAKDQLTAAIIGLLFIIFSLVILELITRDILGLPDFGA